MVYVRPPLEQIIPFHQAIVQLTCKVVHTIRLTDVDSDLDGTPNCLDECPSDPGKTETRKCACNDSDVDCDNDGTRDCHDKCPRDPLE